MSAPRRRRRRAPRRAVPRPATVGPTRGRCRDRPRGPQARRRRTRRPGRAVRRSPDEPGRRRLAAAVLDGALTSNRRRAREQATRSSRRSSARATAPRATVSTASGSIPSRRSTRAPVDRMEPRGRNEATDRRARRNTATTSHSRPTAAWAEQIVTALIAHRLRARVAMGRPRRRCADEGGDTGAGQVVGE